MLRWGMLKPAAGQHALRGYWLCTVVVLVCATQFARADQANQMVAEQAWPPAAAELTLSTGPEQVALEIAVVVFETGIPAFDERDARHKLRGVESRLAAARLRDVMTASERFGAVRVLPRASQFAALTITGEIRHSDGRDFVLAIHAVDAEGRTWVRQSFRATASPANYLSSLSEPFDAVFVAISNAVWSQASLLSAAQITRLNTIAELRYAQGLVPQWYNDYLEERDGKLILKRLPAADDPMVKRIQRVRNQEALFIDTVDEQYLTLREQLGPSYRLWAQSSLEQALYLASYQKRASERTMAATRGSFAAMQQVYSTYRSVRIQEQDLFELATGFDNETAPTVMASGKQLVRLEGTLEQQYTQWRDLLAQIMRLERGIE